MNPKELEIISKLDKSIKQHDITDIAANFRMAVGMLGKQNFKVIIGYLNIYRKIINRDLDLFISFLNVVKPETEFIERHNNDNLYHIFIREGNWKVCERLLETEAVFSSTNLKGETPLSILVNKIADGDNNAREFYIDKHVTSQVIECLDKDHKLKDIIESMGLPVASEHIII